MEELGLKTFAGPWTRKRKQLLVACSKCQRKLKDDGDASGLGKLKKLLKKRCKRIGLPVQLQVIESRCLKVCPRRGVAVCTQKMLGEGRAATLRTAGDVDLLLAMVQNDAIGGKNLGS